MCPSRVKEYTVKKQCLHLGAFSGGVDHTPCHFPCREPPKCRVRATGPVTWGLGVPGCRPGRRGETEGAGAALTAGRATAGTREARAQGNGWGEEEGSPGPGTRAPSWKGRGKREGERARGGADAPAEGAADRDVGPVAPRDAVQTRGGASRTGGARVEDKVSGSAGRPPARMRTPGAGQPDPTGRPPRRGAPGTCRLC